MISSDSTSELLLEIGTEELPAGFISPALEYMRDSFSRWCEEKQIFRERIEVRATPRRLVLYAEKVADQQREVSRKIVGPSVAKAYKPDGTPTKAALGFAKGLGVSVSELSTEQSEKGEYVYGLRREGGVSTKDILEEYLPQFILSMPFPKSMRWAEEEIRFGRPIHWILALFGGTLISFQVGNVQSGVTTRGHRFLAPQAVEVKDYVSYCAACREGRVVLNGEERRASIIAELNKASTEKGGVLLSDEDLLDEVTNLVEYPFVTTGSFDPEFLRLPRDVLITSMREHQRYFSVVQKSGELLPVFIAVNNIHPKDPRMVAKGHERVLRARLKDAAFFFQEDQKKSLKERVELLKGIIFQEKLGTSYEKMERFKGVAGFLVEKVNPELKGVVDKVAFLCKADLTTEMVGEFPSLQGIMGREYAIKEGRSEGEATGIYEHWLPVFSGGELPQSVPGALVSIADKLDTIVGCFGIGLLPTGTADPYALRRQTLGIIQIILHHGFSLPLSELINASLDLLQDKINRPRGEVHRDVLDFFRGRIVYTFTARGLSADTVEAVLTAGFDDLVDCLQRIEELQQARGLEEFDPLIVAFKRVANILRNVPGVSFDAQLLQEEAERDLWKAFQEAEKETGGLLKARDYSAVFQLLASLRAPVDRFFTEVMVMVEDEAVKSNRLALLQQIAGLFFKIADFTKLTSKDTI